MKVGFSTVNQSAYNAIPCFQDQLTKGIQIAGGTPVSCRNLEDTVGLDAFVLLNTVPLNIQKDIVANVGQYWTYLLDAPFHHAGWIWLSPFSVNYAVIDPSHNELLGPLNRTGKFLPHGGDTHSFKSWKDRDIDVLFAGTAPNFPLLRSQLEKLSPELRDIAQLLIQEGLSFSGLPLFQQLMAILKQTGRNMDITDSMTIMALADQIVRGTHRTNLLTAFSDFSVVVAGEGWDQENLSSNHQWIGEVPFSEVARLMSRTKIVLCPSSGFTHGAHERILTAMGSGAVPLAMPTPYLSQYFEHGTHLAYFYQIQEAVDLGRLILNGSHWEIVGEAGHQVVGAAHSWIHRGEELYSFLQNNIEGETTEPISPLSDLIAHPS